MTTTLYSRYLVTKKRLIEARAPYIDSLLWRWYARKAGPLAKIDAAIAALDGLYEACCRKLKEELEKPG